MANLSIRLGVLQRFAFRFGEYLRQERDRCLRVRFAAELAKSWRSVSW